MATFEGRFSDAGGLRVGIVVARFNDLVTAKLLSGCLDCLKRHGVDVSETSSQLDLAWVPGSFELPIVAQQMARSGQYQVLITLGAVIRGDTPHFDVVVSEASKGIASVARDTAVPVLYASSEDSGRSNRLILLGSAVWVALVLLNWGVSFFVV